MATVVRTPEQLAEATCMDLKKLTQLMVKHGAVIRAIPESIRSVVEKRHAAQYPNAEVKFLPEYKREMLVSYKRPAHAGKFALTFAKHTSNDLVFTKWRFFNSLEEVAEYLTGLEKN